MCFGGENVRNVMSPQVEKKNGILREGDIYSQWYSEMNGAEKNISSL